MRFRLILALALIIAAVSVLADGRVTTPNVADPVATWRIAELKFPLLASKSAIVQVAYIRESGAVDHITEHSFTGTDYVSFLGALNTSSGAGEADCVTDGIPDLSCILNLRLSNWMVTHGKIDGVTAEPLPQE